MVSQLELDTALGQLPDVRHALAYGSGVFEQPGAPVDPNRMVDLLLMVDDPVKWHAANLTRNPEHYAFLPKLVGAAGTAAVADRVGVGVHFNAYVRIDPPGPGLVKYGVVSADEAVADLTRWDSLYISGRLHKPVRHIVEDARLQAANACNLRAALTAALLLLPEAFSEQQLMTAIVGLSYTGDVRMGIAEDNKKVARIAAGSAVGLRGLYAEALAGPVAARAGLQTLAPGRYAQDSSPGARTELVSTLPAGMLRALAKVVQAPAAPADAELEGMHAWEVGHAVAARRDAAVAVGQALSAIVAASSRRQFYAGVFAAGGMRGVRYLGAKLSKAWKTKTGK